MGLLSSILGTASSVSSEALEKEFADLLVEGEAVEAGFHIFRDLVVFTNLRLITVDKQGLTGKKKSYTCIPYRSIEFFSKETAGHFDVDAEIKIWVRGRDQPLSLEFRRDAHIHDVFRLLSTHALKP